MLDELDFIDLPDEPNGKVLSIEEIVLDLVDSLIEANYKSADPFEYRAEVIKEFAENNNLEIDYIDQIYQYRLREYIQTKVQAYISAKLDVYNRILERGKLEAKLKHFVPGGKEKIKEVIDYFEREQSKPVVINTKDFLALAKQKDDSNYVVESILHKRMLMLLVAYAKVGKTSLAYNLIVAAATGKDWLNRKTYQTKVLLIQNEEGLKEASKKVYTNKLEEYELEDPELFNSLIKENRIVVVQNVDIIEDLELIFRIVEEEKIGLIVIDALISSIKKAGLNETSYELGSHLYRLQSYVHQHDVCCILLHHTTKAENSESASARLKSAGGSSQIMRANDGCLSMYPFMERKQIVEGKISLFFDLRHSSPFSMTIERKEGEAAQLHWEVTSEDLLTGEALTTQNNILRIIYSKYCEWIEEQDEDLPVYGVTTSDLVDILGLKREDISKRINWMIRAGGIEYRKDKSTKTYIYHYPVDGYSWLYKYVEEEDERASATARLELEDQLVRDALAAATTLEQVSAILEPLPKEDKNRIWNKIPTEERNRIRLLLHPPKYEVGSLVSYEEQCYTIERITFGSEPKDVPIEERRLYYLKGLQNPIRELLLQEYVPTEYPAEELNQELNDEEEIEL